MNELLKRLDKFNKDWEWGKYHNLKNLTKIDKNALKYPIGKVS